MLVDRLLKLYDTKNPAQQQNQIRRCTLAKTSPGTSNEQLRDVVTLAVPGWL
jgi:hypothetical protein